MDKKTVYEICGFFHSLTPSDNIHGGGQAKAAHRHFFAFLVAITPSERIAQNAFGIDRGAEMWYNLCVNVCPSAPLGAAFSLAHTGLVLK